jgi:hypothetical protein
MHFPPRQSREPNGTRNSGSILKLKERIWPAISKTRRVIFLNVFWPPFEFYELIIHNSNTSLNITFGIFLS